VIWHKIVEKRFMKKYGEKIKEELEKHDAANMSADEYDELENRIVDMIQKEEEDGASK
jgi:hypothetical protein